MNAHNEKIIVATDFHYGLGKNSTKKLQILKEFVEPKIFSELENGDCDKTFIICGDLFHEMVSIRTDIYKEARRFLAKCAEYAHVIVIAGNHDCYENTTDTTSVEMFEQLDNIEVIKYPTERTLYGKKCLFLPWVDNNTCVFDFKDESYDYLFCHPDVPKEFFSCLYTIEHGGNMQTSEKKMEKISQEKLLQSGFENTNFSDSSLNDILLSKPKLETVRKLIHLVKEGGEIFAGHIHTHSESHISGRMFYFVGSPYQTTSEERDSKSGFYVLTNNKTKFNEIVAPEFVRIKFSDVKKYGIEKYDFSKVCGNIIQFDGDDVISVELESALKNKIQTCHPFEVTVTDYSNLVVKTTSVENGEKYEKAFAESPKRCLDIYIDNLPENEFTECNVSRQQIREKFDKLYDYVEKMNGIVTTDGGAKINYKKMIVSNFLSYENLEFDFKKYKGLTLIYGKNLDNPGATNACGKSNIIKAISFALFGRFLKKVKKENVTPWGTSGKTVNVTIFLESDGVNYRIDSGLKNGKDSYHRVFNIDKDIELTKKQIAETRKFIETEILHCSFDMFMKTTILTSSDIFNFYAMKKEDKDDYMNTIFGTKSLMGIRNIIKDLLKPEEFNYKQLCSRLDGKLQDIQRTEDAIERFEKDRNEKISILTDEISELEIKISELKSSETPELQSKRKSFLQEKDTLTKQLEEINKKLKKINIDFIKTSSGKETAKKTISLYKDELDKHKTIIPKLCDSCKSIVATEYNLLSYTKKIKESRENLKKYETDSQTMDCEKKTLEIEQNRLISKIFSLDRELAQISSPNNELIRTEAKIEEKRNYIETEKNRKNTHLEILDSLKKDKEKIETDQNSSIKKITYLKFIQDKIVSQDVITNLLTSKFIMQLNERIRYYLQRLGLNLGVEFDNDFHYEFLRGHGDRPEFNSLSGGESLRIVIATSFAFKDFLESRKNISSNIRFLDEFFEKDADNLGINMTISILKDFSELMSQNVFLISNKLNEINNDSFDNILVVSIKDSKSSLKEESLNGENAV